jgi:hypothetical protein
VIKAKMKILRNSVAMGHLMIKAVQLVKARTRIVIMKMIKKFLKKLLLKLALVVRRRLRTLSDEEEYPWKMWLGVFMKGSLQGANYLTLVLIMLLSLV